MNTKAIMIFTICAEIVSIITILTLYCLYAFRWSTISDRMALIMMRLNEMDMDGAYTAGCILWGFLYFLIFIAGNIYGHIRASSPTPIDNQYKYLYFFVSFSAAHIIYHLIRWPIFVSMLLGSIYYTDISTIYDGYDNTTRFYPVSDINIPLAITAFYMDLIVVVGFAILYGIGCAIYGILRSCGVIRGW